MARLPVPGEDAGSWGQILNDFLSQAHSTDGSLNAGAVTPASLADGSVTQNKLSATGGASGQVLSTDGTNLNWATISGSGSVPDATTSAKGIVQLAGDLAGTAAAPTVPGLASKANTVHTHTASQISDSTTTGRAVLVAVDASAARAAIGAGTSNLAIGTTSTTAKAGDYAPTKADVGLGNADNTSDVNKPVSTAVQAALNAKADTTSLATVATTGVYNDLTGKPTIPAQFNPIAGTNVTLSGTYPNITFNATPGAGVTDITISRDATSATVVSSTGADGVIAAADTTDAGVMTAADKTKLNGIATGATANSADATLLARANHTGSQAISTVTNLQTTLDSKAASSHTHTASNISDSTTVGRAVLTAADTAAAQASLGITNTVQVVDAFADVTTPVYGILYVVRA